MAKGKSSVALNGGKGGKSLAISKIVADGALLEFRPSEPGFHVCERVGVARLTPPDFRWLVEDLTDAGGWAL